MIEFTPTIQQFDWKYFHDFQFRNLKDPDDKLQVTIKTDVVSRYLSEIAPSVYLL